MRPNFQRYLSEHGFPTWAEWFYEQGGMARIYSRLIYGEVRN